MLSEEVVVASCAFGQASAMVESSSPFGPTSSTIASTITSQSLRSLGSVVTRSRDGSAPSILAHAATTFSSARQADASLLASRIVSAVVVETAASPVAMAPLPAIPGLSYPVLAFMAGFLSDARQDTRARYDWLTDQSIDPGGTAMADNGNGKFGGREVVIVEAVRTPIGRGHEEKGYYKDVHASNLLAKAYSEVIERAGIDASEVEDVVAGCVQQFGEQGVNIARNAWLEAGLPIETPATTVDRQSGSAQQAVNFAAALIASGVHDVAIGGGVEHMGHISFADSYSVMQEHGMAFSPELMERYNLVPQGISAEMIADKWEIPRSELDELGVRSHQLAAKATEEGRFEREIVPFPINGDVYATDQGIRPETSLEVLSQLKPAFKEDGKVTAGNSSQVSDGAAAVLLMTREKADALGLKPRARIYDQTTVGVDPVIMLTGPIPATKKLLERNGMAIDDIDLVEVNEAFASVLAAWRRELEPDMDRVNVNGGAIALGHPLGSTGARLVTTLLHEMERSDKEMGLVTMCCGGGLGTGTIIQRV